MSETYQPPSPPASDARGAKTSLGLESHVGAMLCYVANFLCCLGVILAVIFLVTEKENRFVKFHAVQSLLLAAVQIAIGIVIGILGVLLRLGLEMAGLSWLAFFMIFGLRIILVLIFALFWIIAGVKAYGGQWYKLPVIGNFAWNTVNK